MERKQQFSSICLNLKALRKMQLVLFTFSVGLQTAQVLHIHPIIFLHGIGVQFNGVVVLKSSLDTKWKPANYQIRRNNKVQKPFFPSESLQAPVKDKNHNFYQVLPTLIIFLTLRFDEQGNALFMDLDLNKCNLAQGSRFSAPSDFPQRKGISSKENHQNRGRSEC